MTNTDYVDAFVNGFVVKQRMHDRLTEAEERRLLKTYRQAHPELGARARLARVLRGAADRLAPEPDRRPRRLGRPRPLTSAR
ncbi:hypothetical protein [Microlunatus sp. Gsoil 973]|jgi:hypothetical protein|uniref:hypothetical protein n=1 Tax=Microlunatus sp. Gsoil 973 TaxID=2672569 RepID=UPI0012B4C8B4|nr:hypothetical protein [Microlunatus sp. Gsoil 973]QGN34721.1 hypothetical protein GJV80_19930 [Microlunatus sp. Gsoil 973]